MYSTVSATPFSVVVGRAPVIICLFLLTLVGVNILKRRLSPFRGIPFPPGPEPKPFIGNAHRIPSRKPWVTYANWAKQYGSLVHLKDYSKHIIIINSLKDAINLLEKRSNIYSDRPTSTMANLMGWDFNAGLIPYGNKWRHHRRIFQKSFKKDVSVAYQPIQTRKIHDMLRSILETPEDFILHYKTVAAAIIMSSVYAHDITPTNDYFVSLSEAAVMRLSSAIFPGAAAVNAFPVLQYIPSWFPGAGFKRFAAETKYLTDKMQDVPFRSVRENMSRDLDNTSILAELLRENDAHGGSKEAEDVIKAVSATAYAAGADTTVSAIGSFFHAMARHPLAQQKAQQEIDKLIGSQRLPNFDDRKSLPYVEALFREVMRWRPVLPLGVSHAALIDDIYSGYYIPKVISNIWYTLISVTWVSLINRYMDRAMAHDQSVYTDPDAFRPERFTNKDGELNDDDRILAFGFERRICPGRHMVASTVWLTIVSILAVFNIEKDKDESGEEIPITDNYTDVLVSHPLPFRCAITPRSEEVVRLVIKTKNE